MASTSPRRRRLKLDLRGDARDPLSFTARLRATAPSAQTPWGSLTQGHATVGLYPPGTNRVSRAELRLGAEEADTPWGRTENLQLAAHLFSAEGRISLATGDLALSADAVQTKWVGATNLHLSLLAASEPRDTNMLSAALMISAGGVGTPWGSATNAQFTAQWLHALTNAVPLTGDGQLIGQGAYTQWGTAGEVRLKAHLATLADKDAANSDPSWGAWRLIAPYFLDWEAQVTELRSPQLAAQQVSGGGSWCAPKLAITNLVARLDERRLEAHAALDVSTRDFTLKFWSNLDPHRAGPLVAKGAERWLKDIDWDQPPELAGEVSLIVPAWTNRPANWPDDLRSSVRLNSEITLAQGVAYRDVRFTSARSHLLYSNGCWRLPDLALTQPSGRLDAALAADPRTTEYSAHINSSLDPRTLRPALSQGAREVLDLFTFTEAPWITADLCGRWEDPRSIGAQGQVSLTNFTFREQAISGVQTGVQYTNQFLQFIAPHVQRGTRQATADGVGADFIEQKVYLTNAYTTIEPMVIARIIGAHVARAIEPYQFEQPPVSHVHGIVPMYGEDAADLHFDLAGGPFNWWRFHIPEISGHVHWLGQHLRFSNMRMRLYGGQAQGFAGFDFHPGGPTDYHFSITTTNTDLQAAVADLFLTTNRLRGTLSGTLIITNANTTSLQSWNGLGNAQLRDGLIWDIPIFGLFSDVLNGMYPGLGSSRPSAGTCTFGIANGVIQSSDLEINATTVRLQYRGTVDFEGRVKARVEAGLLRDMWLVGPVVSTVFWPVTKLFEYKVSGTLSQPKAEPVFLLPKVMLLPFQMPFHPFRTLKGLLPEDFGTSRTNGPPLNPPKGR